MQTNEEILLILKNWEFKIWSIDRLILLVIVLQQTNV